METVSITHSFFIIFCGASVLATIALYGRQPLLLAYIALGAIVGPSGFGLLNDPALFSDIAHTGILFLLFLLGLDMQPKALLAVIRNATVVALVSSVIFAGCGYLIAIAFGFTTVESLIIGSAMMFSSTIIGIKLLPTTVLHHKHSGELIIGILLLQDLIAIFVLIAIMSGSGGQFQWQPFVKALGFLPLLTGGAFIFVKYVLLPLLMKFDRFHEYIFLIALGWCLGMGELAHYIGLSSEIGAFIAGITLATSPISQYIAESLKPLRDFFLILFFFALGAGFDLSVLPDIWLPAMVLAALMLVLKPVTFRFTLGNLSESKKLAWDVGLRLGQISEFSLLVAFLAFEQDMLSKDASHLIQATALITFIISSYLVIFNCTNPIAVNEKLRRD